MTSSQLIFLFLAGLLAMAIGADGMRLRKRSGMTRTESWRYDSGYGLMGKVFFVGGSIMSLLSGIGWVLEVLNFW